MPIIHVATIAPMKRGLKGRTTRIFSILKKVATIAAMKSGLKGYKEEPTKRDIVLVATIAPMKRIKGADSDRDSQYSGVIQELGV